MWSLKLFETEWALLQPMVLWLLPLALLPLALQTWLQSSRTPSCWSDCLQPFSPRLRLPSWPLSTGGGDASAVTKPRQSVASSRTAALLASALLCLLLALAQPAQRVPAGASPPPAKLGEPVDAWLLVSTALSMVLRDYSLDGQTLTRMQLARRYLDRFAAQFQGQRMGLMVLGQPPRLWVPLSSDRRLLRYQLARLQTTLGGRNSALGDGLAALASAHRAQADLSKDTGQDDTGQEAIALVVTDAGLERGHYSPRQGMALAKAAGLTVYFIVLGNSNGSDNSAPANARTENEGKNGGLLYRRADLSGLQALVDEFGGQLFHATDAAVIEQALETVSAAHRHPTTVIENNTKAYWRALFAWPLGLAMGLLLLAWRSVSSATERMQSHGV